jgi:hypothetical protein
MMVFGGVNGNSILGDMWALSMAGSPAWSALTPSGSGRYGHTAIYDPVRDRMVVFGGFYGGSGQLNDVQALSLAGSPAWSVLPSAPSARAWHTAIYDPMRDRMVVFGGGKDGGAYYSDDAWALGWGFSTSLCPVRNEIVSFDRGPGTSVTNAWQSVGPADGRATPLGYKGRLVLRFPNGISNGPGPDLVVCELGHGSPPAIDENYRVEASSDGSAYVKLGDAPGDLATFDLATGGLSRAHYVRITDLPPMEQTGTFDATVVGADIDAVLALHCPGNETTCTNGIDDDGDGLVDCADPDCRVDADGDGHPAPPCGSDCNDGDDAIHPGSLEVCGNGVDEDCDGALDCNDSCTWPAAARPGDCLDPCNVPSQFCRTFEWIGGALPAPITVFPPRFDLVVGVDDRSPVGEAGLKAEAIRVMQAFRNLPAADTFTPNISWWIYPHAVHVPRTKQEQLDAETSDPPEFRSFKSLLTLMASYGLDKPVFLVSNPADAPVTVSTAYGEAEARRPFQFSIYIPDLAPSGDDEVAALHEIGHLFGLTDEYYNPSVENCKECPKRGRPFVIGETVPNVFAGDASKTAHAYCADALLSYCLTGECFDFCVPVGSRSRLGDDDHNQNLMRAFCTEYGQHDVPRYANAYGALGNIHLKQQAEFMVVSVPCLVPYGTAASHDGISASSASSPGRQAIVTLEMLNGMPTQTHAVVVPDSGNAIVPGGDPIDLRLLDGNGLVLSHEAVWDPAYLQVGSVLVDSSARTVSYQIPLVEGARAWQLVDTDGTVRAGGSLNAALLDYCLRFNWTDADCFVPEGPLAVRPTGDPATVHVFPAWPNPTRDRVFFRLELSLREAVSVGIFDVTGRRLRTLAAKIGMEPGVHTLEWDSKDDDGRRLPPGVYFCALDVGHVRIRRTIILVK